MSDDLHPYTVSAVVNTVTGELVGTPVVRAGHEDYDGFDSVEPLAATEQFRWVHVWARDRASAAATDALTADLRPGADPNTTVARTLTGDAGLKPYSVAAVVRTRTSRPIGQPVAVEGHHVLAGAAFVGRRGTRAYTAKVWARDEADAIAQVLTTNSSPHRAGRHEAAATARADPGNVVALEAAVAQRQWERLAGMPAPARALLVADTVWSRVYPPAYRAAYTAAASRIAAAATEAAASNPGGWLTLHQLTASAGEAIIRLAPGYPDAPPADQRTVAAAQAAVTAPGQQTPWRRIAEVAATSSRTAGMQAGSLTATADILAGWRGRSGHAMADGITVDSKPARAWVNELLAAVNRETAGRVAVVPARTAAQRAREDQAPGVSSSTVGSVSGRAQPAQSPAPAPTTTRRTR